MTQLSLLDLCQESQSLSQKQSSQRQPLPITAQPQANADPKSQDLTAISVSVAGGSPILSIDHHWSAERLQKPADVYSVGDRVKVLAHEFVQGKVGTINQINIYPQAVLVMVSFGKGENLWAIGAKYLELVKEAAA